MLNISRYIGGAPVQDNFYLLFHGYTGAVDKVPKGLGNFLKNHTGESLNQDTMDSLGLKNDDIAFLMQRGYLTNKSSKEEQETLIEIATIIHEGDLTTMPPSVMIIPSYVCNLRCPYCFQDHKMHSGKDNFSSVINKEQVDTVFSILDELVNKSVAEKLKLVNLDKKIKRSYPSTMSLFGGEPLASNTLPIIPYILEKAMERGMSLSAITNGVELECFSGWLGKGMISELQITLDGKEELHDRRRIGPKFKKTFLKIADNIDLALSKGVSINVRINIDDNNFMDLKDLSAFFKERGWDKNHNFNSHASSVFTDNKSHKEVTPEQLVEETLFLKETEGSLIESYEIYARDFLKSALLSSDYPFKSSVNCSAEAGLLIFDPLGDVYACWEDVGYAHLKVGTYDINGLRLLEHFSKQWLLRFPGNIDECSQCPYALIHKSGCASHARKNSGTIYSNSCETFKSYFPTTLSFVYEQFEDKVLTAY